MCECVQRQQEKPNNNRIAWEKVLHIPLEIEGRKAQNEWPGAHQSSSRIKENTKTFLRRSTLKKQNKISPSRIWKNCYDPS